MTTDKVSAVVSAIQKSRGANLSSKRLASVIDELRNEFDGLTPFEQRLILQAVSEIKDDGKSSTLRALWDADYLRKPVTVEQLLEDDYYFGKMTGDLYPAWREDLCAVMNPASGVHEWIFAGAIGIGKSSIACFGMAILIYYMSCLRDPHKFYGLVKGTTIVFGIYSITKTQAQDTSFAKIRTLIDESPYFRECFPRIQKIKSKIVFQRGAIQVVAGSNELHVVGLDLFGLLHDEANFMKDPRKPKSGDDGAGIAYKLYNAAKTRIKSRFMQKGGTIPGMVFLISSKKTHRSFLEKHIEEVKNEIKEGTVRLSEYSIWEVLKGTKKAKDMQLFTKPVFKVELGDTIYPSRILETGMDPRLGADVIDVPGEYRSDFVNDIDQALRDIAGIATYGVSPLIHNRQAIQECISKEIEHPFTREVISLDERNDIMLDQYFIPEKLFVVRRSTYIPRLHPTSPRFVHIDIGLTGDCAGIACVHPAGFKEVRRMRGDGTYYMDKCPKIYTDFMLRILPPSGSEIDISKIRSFIISLRDHGLPIVAVTCDGFSARDLQQLLRKLNFESTTLSIDRNDEPYLYLRQTIVERRLTMYRYDPVIIELTDLERDIEKRKVDHPKTSNITGLPGSKDVADGLAGSVTTCIIDPRTSTSEGLGQEVYEDGRPRAGGYVIPEVSSASGSVDWSKIEEESRR